MCYYGCVKAIIEDQSFLIHIPGYISKTYDSQGGKPPGDLWFVFLCRIVKGNYLRLRGMNDPEKYKGDNFNKTSSIQGVHDGTAKIKCWSYSITRLIESKRVEHCFISRPQS